MKRTVIACLLAVIAVVCVACGNSGPRVLVRPGIFDPATAVWPHAEHTIKYGAAAGTVYTQGQTLVATSGVWTGNPTFSYTWLRCNSSGVLCVGAQQGGTSYVLTGADVGSTIELQITAVQGSLSTTVYTNLTGVILANGVSAPTNTAPPTITGTPTQGLTLSASTGTWTGSPGAFAYQWLDCNASGSNCVNATGTPSTGPNYTLVAADVGHTIRVTVTATNTGGSASANSAQTAVVIVPAGYKPLPSVGTWYWQIGGGTLPAFSAAYPNPGSANIWDTDLFNDSNVNGAVPTASSPTVTSIHNAGHYSICYVEVGAQQTGFPDASNFASADYGGLTTTHQMQNFPDEYWFDIAGFSGFTSSNPTTYPDTSPSNSPSNDVSAAANIASGLDKRFADCKLEGQDAVEADDLDGYTNPSQSGAAGGGWNLTQADSAGFEAWLAYDIHKNGLAWVFKNDPANASSAVSDGADGMIIEECNFGNDPCSTDVQPFLNAHLPVLNAEYTEDGETTAKFCSTDHSIGIWGALFNQALNGGTYQVCWNSAGVP